MQAAKRANVSVSEAAVSSVVIVTLTVTPTPPRVSR